VTYDPVYTGLVISTPFNYTCLLQDPISLLTKNCTSNIMAIDGSTGHQPRLVTHPNLVTHLTNWPGLQQASRGVANQSRRWGCTDGWTCMCTCIDVRRRSIFFIFFMVPHSSSSRNGSWRHWRCGRPAEDSKDPSHANWTSCDEPPDDCVLWPACNSVLVNYNRCYWKRRNLRSVLSLFQLYNFTSLDEVS